MRIEIPARDTSPGGGTMLRSVALSSLLSLAMGCALARRVDDNAYEVRGNAKRVDKITQRVCGDRPPASVSVLEYVPEHKNTANVTSSQTTTGSCDNSGTCLQTTSTTSNPIEITIPAHKKVRVQC
jgi:hypothetical protein